MTAIPYTLYVSVTRDPKPRTETFVERVSVYCVDTPVDRQQLGASAPSVKMFV